LAKGDANSMSKNHCFDFGSENSYFEFYEQSNGSKRVARAVFEYSALAIR